MSWTRRAGWFVILAAVALLLGSCVDLDRPSPPRTVTGGAYSVAYLDGVDVRNRNELWISAEGTAAEPVLFTAEFDLELPDLTPSALARARFSTADNLEALLSAGQKDDAAKRSLQFPIDLVDDLRRLAELTRQSEELGRQIAPRLLDGYALDRLYEFSRLLDEWRALGEERQSDPLFEEFGERIDRWSDGSERRSALAIRAMREEIARRSGRLLTSAFEQGTD